MNGIHFLIQKGLPGRVEGMHPPGFGRHIQHFDAGGGFFGLDGVGTHSRVKHHGTAALGSQGPGQAHFLPVVGAFFARSPAVQLGNGDGQHCLGSSCFWVGMGGTFARYRASMISTASSRQ